MRAAKPIQEALFSWLYEQPSGDHSQHLKELGITLLTSQGEFWS